jgi:D-serine deaminase-like pyridoxal phosphate-dependent protein
MDSGLAGIRAPTGGSVSGQSDEHMVVAVADGAAGFSIGDRVRLIPGHVDPTFNLHDWVVCFSGDIVADIWPISARGPGL